MKVKLNAFRGDDRPGDVVDVTDAEAAEMIAHGAAYRLDNSKAAKSAKAGKPATRRARTVRGEAALQAASDAGTDEAPAP